MNAIDFKLMFRIARWIRNYGPGEGLTKELFAETFGSAIGNHYFEKWNSVYIHNIFAMIAYFGHDTKEGQKFCDMIFRQMTVYENRLKEVQR